MMGVDREGLLAVVAEAARARQPLPPALRASGVAGAPELARRLEEGMDLPGACTGLLPPSLAPLLAGERPRLEHAALFAAGQMRAAQQRRHHLLLVVVPALLSLGAAIAVLAVVAGPLGLAADWRWLLAAAAGAALVVLPLAGLAEAGWSAALGPFTAWARHGRWAWRWERAALVARWRPDEAPWP